MPTGAELAAKLAEAISSVDTAESATAETEQTETQAQESEAAAKETGEKGKSDAAKVTTEKETSEEGKSQTVPYDRFKQKVDQVNELEPFKTRAEELERQVSEFTTRERELQTRIEELEQEHTVLERVRALAKDDRYRPMVEKLDKAIRGVHEEVESGDKTEKEGQKEVADLVKQSRQELEDAFAEQRADLLWQQASSYAERLLEALPETYEERDRAMISKLWTPEVNWDSIEDNPDLLRDELLRSLKTVLEEYGEPRGALKQKVKDVETKSQQAAEQAQKGPDPEQEVRALLEQDWGAVKTNDEGKVVGAEKGDDEFSRALARVIRQTS